MGFDRHLSAGEIVAQVLYFARELRAAPWTAAGLPGSTPIDHITNIVLMGMGEPLHNYNNVLQALRILNSAEGFNLGARHMTVSTVGLVPAIRKLSQEPLQVNLAISLHAPTDELRSQTMPINRKYPVQELIAACKDYIAATRRQVTFEYVLTGRSQRHSRVCPSPGRTSGTPEAVCPCELHSRQRYLCQLSVLLGQRPFALSATFSSSMVSAIACEPNAAMISPPPAANCARASRKFRPASKKA